MAQASEQTTPSQQPDINGVSCVYRREIPFPDLGRDSKGALLVRCDSPPISILRRDSPPARTPSDRGYGGPLPKAILYFV